MNDFTWTVGELLARYELEPDLLDVFVEGSFDQEVLSQHRSGGCAGRTFYEIDVVDVPATTVEIHGLTLGNKQRVIALSKELCQVSSSARVVCLVDRDLDHWFAAIENSDRLRWSVFCSVESHFLTKDTIRDIAVTTARSKISDFDAFFDSLGQTLRQLYALRLADRELKLNLKWTALRKYLSNNSGTVTFDLTKYALAVLNSNAALNRKADLAASTDRWLRSLECDIRLACRGHDFTELLAWAISEFGGQKEFTSTAAIERLFVLLARSVSSLGQELQ